MPNVQYHLSLNREVDQIGSHFSVYIRSDEPHRVESCKEFCLRYKIRLATLFRIIENPTEFWKWFPKNGRWYYVPNTELENVQTKLFHFIYKKIRWSILGTFPPGSMGTYEDWEVFFPATAYYKRDSIIRNARYHRYNRSSIRIDCANAFESIKVKHIQAFLERAGFSKEQAWVYARLLTFRGRLRKGPSVSPHIFNFLMRRIDLQIIEAIGATKFPYGFKGKVVLTRFGDDICVSHPDNEFPPEFEGLITSILSNFGLKINRKKTLYGRNGVLVFPGVVIVNGRIRPTGKYIFKLATQSDGLNRKQLIGHRAFVQGFGHNGRLKIIKRVFRDKRISFNRSK